MNRVGREYPIRKDLLAGSDGSAERRAQDTRADCRVGWELEDAEQLHDTASVAQERES